MTDRHERKSPLDAKSGRYFALWVITSLLCGIPALGETNTEALESKARNAYIERFTKFTQDKNVAGKPRDPNMKVAKGGKKTRFNNDDGLAYQSDLTYHDLAFNTTEESKEEGEDGKTKKERLYAFVSPHGGIQKGGGSSVLERTAYEMHKQFSKADEENNFKADDDKQGIKFRSIYKIETREVTKVEDGKEESDRVERWTLRDEAKTKLEQVGEESFETIRRSGRDEGFEDDDSTLANGVLLRYAAGAASKAFWDSTLANLAQRRVNRAIRSGAFPDTPQLSEGVVGCDNWAAAAQSVLGKVKNEKTRENLQKEIERMSGQCRTVAQMDYAEIAPKYVRAEDGKGEDKLEMQGPDKEEGLQRDMRNQLEVLAKAGKSVDGLQTNWQYEKKDETIGRTIGFDDEAQPQGETKGTVRDQLQSYNEQLAAAQEGYAEVGGRIPDLQIPDVMKYQIESGSKSIMEINQPPASVMDEFGAENGIATGDPARNYTDLVNKAKQ